MPGQSELLRVIEASAEGRPGYLANGQSLTTFSVVRSIVTDCESVQLL